MAISESPASPDRTVLIGRTLDTVHYTIREDDIQDYLPVAGEESDAYLSDKGAQADGYTRRIVPPSFAPFVAVIALLKSFDWGKDFMFNYRTGTAMFGEQELEYLRPLYVGETLTISAEVADVYEKQGRSTFDVIQVRFCAMDKAQTVAFQGAQSYILFK